MQSKDQRYSESVFKEVQGLVADGGSSQEVKRYKSLCKRAGSILRTVGLIQFLVYLKAKAAKASEVHHKYLLDHLASGLKNNAVVGNSGSDDLIEKIRRHNLGDYMYVTRETLRLLQWHKRIADILIEGTAEEGDAS